MARKGSYKWINNKIPEIIKYMMTRESGEPVTQP